MAFEVVMRVNIIVKIKELNSYTGEDLSDQMVGQEKILLSLDSSCAIIVPEKEQCGNGILSFIHVINTNYCDNILTVVISALKIK